AGPGLLATLLGAAAGSYLSVAPIRGSTVAGPPDLAQLAFFLLLGGGVSALGGALHSSRQVAEAGASAAERHLNEHEQMLEGLRIIAAGAQCILWYANVEDCGGSSLRWELKVSDEEAAQRFFPVQIPPGLSYVQAWYESRL